MCFHLYGDIEDQYIVDHCNVTIYYDGSVRLEDVVTSNQCHINLQNDRERGILNYRVS